MEYGRSWIIRGAFRVESGLDQEQIKRLGPLLDPLSDRPYVIAQLGQSLDGRIATPTGESRYINGQAALDHLHLLRAHVDAVIVGAGTIAADDPQLTVRRGPKRNNPARVVIDPRGRLGGGWRWLAEDGVACLIITGEGVAAYQGAQHIALPLTNGQLCPKAIVAALYQRGYKRLLVEGGARTISQFIDAQCLDRLHMLIAPMIIGSGTNGLSLQPISQLTSALRPSTHFFPLDGGDVLFDCDLSSSKQI